MGWYSRWLPFLLNLGEICQAVRGRGLCWKPVTCCETRGHAQRPQNPNPIETPHSCYAALNRFIWWEVHGKSLLLIHIKGSLSFSEWFKGCWCVEPCEGGRSWFSSDFAAVCFSHVHVASDPPTHKYTPLKQHGLWSQWHPVIQRYICMVV